jgi:iron only hydrogenase large subunit-like protein
MNGGHNNNNDKQHHQMAYSSGGHADYIFQYAAKHLFGVTLEQVQWQSASLLAPNAAVRSARLAKQQKQHYYQAQLVRLEDGSYSQTTTTTDHKNKTSVTPPVLHFCIAHGMQTMQRALKQLENKATATTLHYIEAMACPFGCVNGGGAAVVQKQRETPTETKQRVSKTVDSLSVPKIKTDVDVAVATTITKARTRYHVVPPMAYSMGAAAGVKVDDIQW